MKTVPLICSHLYISKNVEDNFLCVIHTLHKHVKILFVVFFYIVCSICNSNKFFFKKHRWKNFLALLTRKDIHLSTSIEPYTALQQLLSTEFSGVHLCMCTCIHGHTYMHIFSFHIINYQYSITV